MTRLYVHSTYGPRRHVECLLRKLDKCLEKACSPARRQVRCWPTDEQLLRDQRRSPCKNAADAAAMYSEWSRGTPHCIELGLTA
jgi:hypothetical protein